MPQTDYHDEELPDPGGDRYTWGDILNDLLQYYDAQIERRGAKSERPSAADVPGGAKYVVDEGDDEGAVYIEDAGSWAKLPVNVVVYSDDSNAPAGTVYFDSTDGQLEYKDAGGTIHSGSGSFSGDPSDLNQEGAQRGDRLKWDGSAWTPVGTERTKSQSVALAPSSTADNFYEEGVYLNDGEAIHLTEAGLSLEDKSVDSAVELRLEDWTGTVQYTLTCSSNENLDTEQANNGPLATFTNGAGELKRVDIIVENTGGADYTADTSTTADYATFEVQYEVGR